MIDSTYLALILTCFVIITPFVVFWIMIIACPDYRIAQLSEEKFVLQKNEWDIGGSYYHNKKEFTTLREALDELKKAKEFNNKYPKYYK